MSGRNDVMNSNKVVRAEKNGRMDAYLKIKDEKYQKAMERFKRKPYGMSEK